MVRKSITQRFVAMAWVGATVITFFSPVEAPAQSAENLLPPGLCTKERHRHLQDIVESASSLVRGCSAPLDTIETMSEKIARFRDAIIARENINLECFGKADPGHKKQVEDLGKGMAKCQKLRAAKRKHQDRCPGKPHLMAGSLELLQALQADYRLGIISNGVIANQTRKLRSAGIHDLVHGSMGRDRNPSSHFCEVSPIHGGSQRGQMHRTR
jgi:hypothetical protein